MVIGKGLSTGYLSQDEIRAIVDKSLTSLDLDHKRVLFIIPDTTRTMPMPFIFELFNDLLKHRATKIDYLIALGTHQPLNDGQMSKLVGGEVINGQITNSHIFNHEWQRPEIFRQIGDIKATEIAQITDGLLSTDVPIVINQKIYDYDQLIICGPVFPHEVVGFSGGNKYLFPGIAGPEIINFTHWLGALITSNKVIGTQNTFVRAVINRAAEYVDKPIACFSFVVTTHGTAGIFFGEAKEAWHEAAKLSAHRHIVYKDKKYARVLSIMPRQYDDLWTAAKGMYKLEPIIEDGGEVIIYAPHIHEVSYTHGKLIDTVGYHCRDYFLYQWEKFKEFPGGVLAHSTHLRGLGTYDPVTKVETSRIRVILATGISPERCRRINLEYMSPDEVRFDEWQCREEEGILVVPHAGEILYRLASRESTATEK